MGVPVFLVSRTDLPEDLVFLILEGLFDNIADLLLAHTAAQDIKLTRAFEVPEEFLLHPGARKFQEKERDTLLIATSTITGKYYRLGRTIHLLLKQHGIRARAIQTDGSLENADLLRKGLTIAIMQYDAALASRFGKPRFVYNVDLPDEVNIPSVPNIRLIAVLHQEQAHVIIHRDKLARIEENLNEGTPKSEQQRITTLSDLAVALKELSPREERLRVCLGSEQSGTQVVARVILKLHGIDSTLITPSFLSVPNMVSRLHSGEIDAGFFVGYVPTEAIQAPLNDDRFKILSLGPKERAQMMGTVFEASTIAPGTYLSQKEDEAAIQTIATRAVLVTTEDLPRDVEKITKAILEGVVSLNVKGGAKVLAQELPSLPMHPDAKRYYQKMGYLPSKPPLQDRVFAWFGYLLNNTWKFLASIVILVSGYQGLMKLRRDRNSNEVGRRLFAVDVEASEPYSVSKLTEMRREIRERVRRRWWQRGEIDKSRWFTLEGLVNTGIKEAKENLARAIVTQIRTIAVESGSKSEKMRDRYAALRERVWKHLENGELDAAQHAHLMTVIEESIRDASEK